MFTPDNREKGQGLVEYAFLIVLVALVVILGLQLLGGSLGDLYSTIVGIMP